MQVVNCTADLKITTCYQYTNFKFENHLVLKTPFINPNENYKNLGKDEIKENN